MSVIGPCWVAFVYLGLPFGGLWIGRALGLPDLPPPPYHLLGLALLVPGGIAAVTCVFLFVLVGRGTPSPYDPPERLVVTGPYAYCRNPMMGANFLAVSGEALLLRAPLVLLLVVLYSALAHLYLVRHEERHLAERFGEAFEEYRRHVPRWLPRLTPYRPARSARADGEHS